MPSPFIEQIRADMRLRGYSLRTEKSYLGWIRQYIYFHKKQHPKKLGSNEVREFLVKIQRQIGKNIDCVIEGRDIGSVVFPKADFKFFLTADLDIRAKRRKNELKKIGEDVTIDEIRASIKKRDLIDSSRKLSPLKRPKDAIEIDSTNLTIDEQIDKIMNIIKKNK